MTTDAGNAFTGRTALVTGGGRGIGRAIALQLAAAGARVAVLSRTGGELDKTVEMISAQGGEALAVPADVSRPDEMADAIGQIAAAWGPPAVLVNNAAVVWPIGRSVSIDPADWAAAMAINLTAVARLTFDLLPPMIDSGWGRIVNVSSGIAARPQGMLRANAYATSKAALEAHTLNLAAEMADTGVTINIYRPGGVDTAMQEWIRAQPPAQIGSGLHDRFTRNHDEGTLITPDDSARSLLARLHLDVTGQIWDASDPLTSTAS